MHQTISVSKIMDKGRESASHIIGSKFESCDEHVNIWNKPHQNCSTGYTVQEAVMESDGEHCQRNKS